MSRGASGVLAALLFSCAMNVLACAGQSDGREHGADAVLYGNITPERYLTGRFVPGAHPLFIELSSAGVPMNGKKQFLRKEAAAALAALYLEFRKTYPLVRLQVRSAARSWEDQKGIWEDKWSGRTPVEGAKLNVTVADPLSRARKIMEYSSMPGVSRHHWGTDVDINELNNRYFERGEGLLLHRWMKENAGRYGFCQPYGPGRNTGYKDEKWHWSYKPLAARYLIEWMSIFRARPALLLREGAFSGAREIVADAPAYAAGISADCE